MKNINTTHILKFAFTIGLIILMQACTIQKRTYNKGYFIQWNLDKHKSQKPSSNEYLVEESKINDGLTEEISSTENRPSEIQNEFVLNSNSDNVNLNNEGSSEYNVTSKNSTQKSISENKTQKKGQKLNVKKIFAAKKLLKKSPAADGELIINIILTVVFLGLTILFLILLLSAVAPLLYVYAVAGLVSLVLFVTQLIDLINY